MKKVHICQSYHEKNTFFLRHCVAAAAATVLCTGIEFVVSIIFMMPVMQSILLAVLFPVMCVLASFTAIEHSAVVVKCRCQDI